MGRRPKPPPPPPPPPAPAPPPTPISKSPIRQPSRSSRVITQRSFANSASRVMYGSNNKRTRSSGGKLGKGI